MLNRKCFSVNTYSDIEQLIKFRKNKKKILVIFIKYYLINGFGVDWLNTFIELIKKNYPGQNIKFYVDSGNNYGLSILILRENIQYLKLKSNKIILEKINQIAKKNKVVLNPNFNVVEVSKIKNYRNLKL